MLHIILYNIYVMTTFIVSLQTWHSKYVKGSLNLMCSDSFNYCFISILCSYLQHAIVIFTQMLLSMTFFPSCNDL